MSNTGDLFGHPANPGGQAQLRPPTARRLWLIGGREDPPSPAVSGYETFVATALLDRLISALSDVGRTDELFMFAHWTGATWSTLDLDPEDDSEVSAADWVRAIPAPSGQSTAQVLREIRRYTVGEGVPRNPADDRLIAVLPLSPADWWLWGAMDGSLGLPFRAALLVGDGRASAARIPRSALHADLVTDDVDRVVRWVTGDMFPRVPRPAPRGFEDH